MTAALNAAPLLLIPPIIQIVFLPEAAQAPGEGSPLAKLEQHLQSFAPLVANVFPGLLGPDGWLASGSADSASRASFLVVIGLAAVSIALLGAAAQFAFVQLSRSLSLRILADIRQDLAAHVVRLGMGYHTGSRKGDLLSRATNDVSVVLGALGILFDDLVLEPLQLAFKVVVCFFANATLTLLVGVFVPVLAIPLLLFGKRVRKGARRSLSALGESTEAMSQMFAGIRVVKAFR
ncbi:MAG TPA: ABC transporter transmembrane domain-containing protein, partial [Planctomycetota bacterium]|nr:ABC transporter transmembrane domain-containing protein [Planctomycetota bacterium]